MAKVVERGGEVKTTTNVKICQKPELLHGVYPIYLVFKNTKLSCFVRKAYQSLVKIGPIQIAISRQQIKVTTTLARH